MYSHLRQVEAEGKLVQAGVQNSQPFLRTVLVWKHKEDVFFHTPALRFAQKRHLLHKGRITSPRRVYLRLLEACKKRIQSRVSAEKTPTPTLFSHLKLHFSCRFQPLNTKTFCFSMIISQETEYFGGFGQNKQCEDAILNSEMLERTFLIRPQLLLRFMDVFHT